MDDDKDKLLESRARLLADPVYQSAVIQGRFGIMPAEDKEGHQLAVFKKDIEDIKNIVALNHLDSVDQLLMSQAKSLNAIFNRLANRAADNLFSKNGNFIDAGERYLKMALKAQQQCTQTLKTLSEHKQPKNTVFANNANIANNQQINNGAAIATKPNAPKQLGAVQHATVDTRIEGATGATDSDHATLEAQHRS